MKHTAAPDALWYKDAVLYELHPKAFHDSNADGLGDFRGLTEKLDYLRDLGVTALWLLPFYPSPLRDDGYDIADYTDVHPSYGTLRDFETFLREAHRRGLKVITELVLNHTSDQHAWFQRARRAAPGSVHRDFYVWSDTPGRYADARIIFKDFETSNWTWDPLANAYYWHRFYSHQPDLNFESAAVRRAMLQVVDFWLRLGVDGLRLDAVPYLYEREGTNCENLPETHAFLQTLRRHVDERFPNRLLLGEANQWPEDATAYFGHGDECHMAFHFPVMPRLFMAIHMEDVYPIIDILEQTPAIPESCQWALFLRNHDELTLEMVTDEERDYMYRVYAHDQQARVNLGIRRRLAPLLGNHRRKIELMKGLLLSLPGTPVLYYGDEIGMGDNIYLGDRDGVRTPMQWSADRNAGFSRANPQRLYLPIVIDPEYHPEALNVEAQQSNAHSLLWWTKRLIALRRRYRAFGRGSIEFLHPENRRVLAFVRRYDGERLLVVANLSRFVQFVELDLSAFRGLQPIEMFGNTEFPLIGDRPYFFTLGPHSFYWFALQAPLLGGAPARREPSVAEIELVEEDWGAIELHAVEAALAGYLPSTPWFAGDGRRLKAAVIVDTVELNGASSARLVLVRATYADGSADTYALPLGRARGAEAEALVRRTPEAVVARVRGDGVLYDATVDPGFALGLLDAIARRRRFQGKWGRVVAAPARALRDLLPGPPPAPSLIDGSRRSTSINYGDRVVLKLLRRLEEGTSPDVEIGRFLGERTSFGPHTPPVAGVLAYESGGSAPATLGILRGFVSNQGDAWQYTLSTLPAFFQSALLRPPRIDSAPGGLVAQLRGSLPPAAADLVGGYLSNAALLGQRTAELHSALASHPEEKEFAPEAFSTLYQRSLYQSMRTRARRTYRQLRQQMRRLPADARPAAQRVLEAESGVERQLRGLLGRKLSASRIRCHGDYRLERVLYTGRDFVVVHFDGDAMGAPSERRIKRSPLRDVASMLRSFHYAVYTAWSNPSIGALVRPEDRNRLEPATRFWYRCVASTFLQSYVRGAAAGGFLPRTPEDIALLLGFYLADKALQETDAELAGRPEAVHIPLRGLVELLENGDWGQAAGA